MEDKQLFFFFGRMNLNYRLFLNLHVVWWKGQVIVISHVVHLRILLSGKFTSSRLCYEIFYPISLFLIDVIRATSNLLTLLISIERYVYSPGINWLAYRVYCMIFGFQFASKHERCVRHLHRIFRIYNPLNHVQVRWLHGVNVHFHLVSSDGCLYPM